MVTTSTGPGRVGIVGSGPAGMAAAMSLLQAGHQPTVLERYGATEPRGNILNLWPPPLEALELLGVDVEDLGAPGQTFFRNHKGRTRATKHVSDELRGKYHGDFRGLLRPELYRRMYNSVPDGAIVPNLTVESFTQDEQGVHVQLSDGTTREFDLLVGADGINSVVRKTLWGEQPIREHNLHVFGGYTMKPLPDIARGEVVLSWSKDKQGSYASIRGNGADGFEWWAIEPHPGGADFTGDYHAAATRIASEFLSPLPELIAATDPAHIHRWILRDRISLKKWSKGRATIIGDASHPTSPYAGYGAGMAIEDGYFLGRALAGVDLTNLADLEAALATFEAPRIAHTAILAERAYKLSQVMHHAPKIARPFRDFIMDYTPFLQKTAADSTSGEIMKQVDIITRTEEAFQAKMRAASTDSKAA